MGKNLALFLVCFASFAFARSACYEPLGNYAIVHTQYGNVDFLMDKAEIATNLANFLYYSDWDWQSGKSINDACFDDPCSSACRCSIGEPVCTAYPGVGCYARNTKYSCWCTFHELSNICRS